MTNKEVAAILMEVKDAMKALNNKIQALELRIILLEANKQIPPIPQKPFPEPWKTPPMYPYPPRKKYPWQSTTPGSIRIDRTNG